MPVAAVLPAFLIALVGFAARKQLHLDISTMSRVCLYILTPALTFNSLATSTVDLAVMGKFFAAAILLPFVCLAVFRPVYKLIRTDEQLARALMLPCIFSNAGNYGLPVCLFAFGQKAVDLGAIFVVAQSILFATLGVFIAASNQLNTRDALRKVARMPAIYAAALGIGVRLSGISIPEFIMRPISLLAGAAVPIFLLVLGLQLSEVTSLPRWPELTVSLFLRLFAAPVLALALGKIIGLAGMALSVFVLEGAMPPPVNSSILAYEFNCRPETVSSVTLAGTIASLATLPLWIYFLR